MENIISCAADGAPVLMGKKKGCLKLMKDEYLGMILVHYVIHRDNFVANNITPPLNEPEMNHRLTVDGKAFVSYLTDIFEKLSMLNKQIQGSNRTLVDAKTKFHWLKKCGLTDNAVLVIVDQLKIIASHLKERFSDLKQNEFPTWEMQAMLVNISDVLIQYQEEPSETQNDKSVETLYNIEGEMSWLCYETKTKYSHSTNFA
ncbi:unnamed protein product [Lepeophtheirus salmonis]|uniref:(salmon louse) hypothetical protein n=1 Tax=Lepeophtheirus salmonis TaxID=72036 RepID=A0A7R8CVZ4_LEPSM|nr:unnamed protein product [Lepeophtheirus salmonis]CAF2898572.1 unnamed protein product [Lepeophtheirus salmonis]